MSDLTEQETYALFANVPYLINEGVPLNVIEEELEDYGLDYKIDPELSDTLSATLIHPVNKDLVHSVRGTDPHSIKDILSDAGIVGSHPFFIKLFNTGSVMFYPFLFANINSDNVNSRIIRNAIYDMYTNYDLLTSWDEGPEYTSEEYIDELKRMEKVVKEMKLSEDIKQRMRMIKGGTAITGSALSLTKAKRLMTDAVRIKPEMDKLNQIKMKYPEHSVSLTGHSLGSLVNVLGRKEKLKSITFNPAPQEMEEKTAPHPGSKVYRVKGDPVSYFLTDLDTEPRIEIKGKYRNLHSLNNFLPDKIIKKIETISPERRENVINNFKINSNKKDDYNVYLNYCRRFPDNPVCKDKEKNIFLV